MINRNFFFIGMILFSCIIYSQSAEAKQGQMPLLAVSEENFSYTGHIANLYLEIKPGSGRVFIETFPLTKLDTQLSTRFAKEMACRFTEKNCDHYDFFYAIRSSSPTVGGPSAGAAISVLTISLLDDLELDKNVAITGTVNSGGLIGPVGGLKEKVLVAGKVNMTRVLIPQGTRFVVSEDDAIDLVLVGLDNNIEIKEVSDLKDVIYEFTGQSYHQQENVIEISPTYENTMREISDKLCEMTKDFKELVELDNSSEYRTAVNLSNLALESFNKEMYYSSASRCFGANIKFRFLQFKNNNLTEEEIGEKIDLVHEKLEKIDRNIEQRELRTITDLQTYMIVKERLLESIDQLDLARENLNNTEYAMYKTAFGLERLNSAITWSIFFGKPGKQFDFNENALRSSCISKLSEAEERYQYVNLFMPAVSLSDTRKELDRAYEDYNQGIYELCLFKASKAKAESDVILSVLGVREDKLVSLIDRKLELIRDNIAFEQESGVFPILGYSYYEYAEELKESDKFSALIYAEYALELSNIDIYFNNDVKHPLFIFDFRTFLILISGFITGVTVTLLLISPKRNKKSDKILIKIK